MSERNTINKIPQKDATTKSERLLLGLLEQEANRVDFGKIVLELTVRAGKLDRVVITETSRQVLVGLREQSGKDLD